LVFNDPDNPADWTTISANNKFRWPDYKDDPPVASGHKVLLSDTDHLWGVGGNDVWVWKSFCRRLNPIFMDRPAEHAWEFARNAMRDILFYAERVDLKRMLPEKRLSTTGYCLVEAGKTYIVYQPHLSMRLPYTVLRPMQHMGMNGSAAKPEQSSKAVLSHRCMKHFFSHRHAVQPCCI
jgi:hypothetical protein